jgi:cytochrome c biogenesis protein CcmG, thiol:disulfide interchange protein DsbE
MTHELRFSPLTANHSRLTALLGGLRHCVVALVLGIFASVAHGQGLQVGQKLPPVNIELTNGDVISQRQLEGKVVLHYFWATWCPICQSDLPELQKLYQAFHTRKFEIIGHSLDTDQGVVIDFWQARGLTFPVAMRSDEVRTVFGPIRGTPTFFLIDRTGTLRLKRLGVLPNGELEKRISALL